MFSLNLSQKRESLRILCLGAHCDDIEIGCGGTILKFIQRYKTASFHWVVLSSNETRRGEAEKSAENFLAGAKSRHVLIEEFRDGYFPYTGREIKDYFEKLKRTIEPDLIFTHYRMDLHQDHRLVSDLTWNTFRDHWIMEYEITKYDGDLGTPNVFVHLDDDLARAKIQLILRSFASQAENQWFREETFRAILRLRGIESNAPAQFAEGFYCRKLVLC